MAGICHWPPECCEVAAESLTGFHCAQARAHPLAGLPAWVTTAENARLGRRRADSSRLDWRGAAAWALTALFPLSRVCSISHRQGSHHLAALVQQFADCKLLRSNNFFTYPYITSKNLL